MKIHALFFLLISFQYCLAQNKKISSNNSIACFFNDDTTYTFKIDKKYMTLPDSLGGKKTYGALSVNIEIDTNCKISNKKITKYILVNNITKDTLVNYYNPESLYKLSKKTIASEENKIPHKYYQYYQQLLSMMEIIKNKKNVQEKKRMDIFIRLGEKENK